MTNMFPFNAVLYPHRQRVTVTAPDVLKVADALTAFDADYAVIKRADITAKAITVTVTFR